MENDVEKPMDMYFSVFNCHINNAQEKAISDFKSEYSEDTYRREIDPFIKNGIMSIFHKKPNRYTMYFVSTIQEYVNNKS